MSAPLRAVWQTLTWRSLFLLQLLGQLAVYLDSREWRLFDTWVCYPSEHNVAMVVSICLTVPIALLCDKTVLRGVSSRLIYPIAIFATLPVAFLATIMTQFAYLSAFGRPPCQLYLFWMSSVETSFHMFVYGAFAMLIYVNQRTADRMLEDLRSSELQRVELSRELVDSRLAAAQVQIDPTLLFNQLADIRLNYARDDDHAEERLNQLIQMLRAALMPTMQALEPHASSLP